MREKYVALIPFSSCGGCPYRKSVFWNKDTGDEYSGCSKDPGILVQGPLWELPKECPFLRLVLRPDE